MRCELGPTALWGMGYGLGRLRLPFRYELGACGPLTPSASAAALDHKNMQAYFCDTRFARY